MSEKMSARKVNKGAGKRWKWVVILVIVGILLAIGYWWRYMRDRVSTDDAYVRADSAAISSRIPGSIAEIHVENDDWVEKGDALIRLDPTDYEVKVEEIRASLKQIEAQLSFAEVDLRLTDRRTKEQVDAAMAQMKEAEQARKQASHRVEELEKMRNGSLAEFENAGKNYERSEKLFRTGTGSESDLDAKRTLYAKAKSALKATDQRIAGAGASLGAVAEKIDQTIANLNAAKAARLQVEMAQHKLAALKAQRSEIEAKLKQAELNISYCTIKAPISGYIAQKSIQVGDWVQPGQPLFAIVPLQRIYVEANFKETQLENIRLGQPAAIEADVYPDYTYAGKVVGIRAGTGAAFALLPPENATGNWIKVVQRVPVKIQIDRPLPPEYPLRVGLSLNVSVNTSDKTGKRLVSGLRKTQ
jgi:membrane fusion protein (multidrug efflux system)